MSVSSSSQLRARNRKQRIRDVVFRVAETRSSGELISDEDVLAAHPDLAPDLTDELTKLRRISGILDQVDEEQCLKLFDRIEQDRERNTVRFDHLPDHLGRFTSIDRHDADSFVGTGRREVFFEVFQFELR